MFHNIKKRQLKLHRLSDMHKKVKNRLYLLNKLKMMFWYLNGLPPKRASF